MQNPENNIFASFNEKDLQNIKNPIDLINFIAAQGVRQAEQETRVDKSQKVTSETKEPKGLSFEDLFSTFLGDANPVNNKEAKDAPLSFEAIFNGFGHSANLKDAERQAEAEREAELQAEAEREEERQAIYKAEEEARITRKAFVETSKDSQPESPFAFLIDLALGKLNEFVGTEDTVEEPSVDEPEDEEDVNYCENECDCNDPSRVGVVFTVDTDPKVANASILTVNPLDAVLLHVTRDQMGINLFFERSCNFNTLSNLRMGKFTQSVSWDSMGFRSDVESLKNTVLKGQTKANGEYVFSILDSSY